MSGKHVSRKLTRENDTDTPSLKIKLVLGISLFDNYHLLTEGNKPRLAMFLEAMFPDGVVKS